MGRHDPDYIEQFAERPRKVHLYQDRTGQTYHSMGKKRPYANTLCKGNFAGPELRTTLNPDEVTCKMCLKKRYGSQPSRDKAREEERDLMVAMSADLTATADRLDAEMRHGDKLVEYIKLIEKLLDDRRHVIAVLGTDISLGDLLDGVLAAHQIRRQQQEDS